MLSRYQPKSAKTDRAWTRIQMLIDLYGETISELQKVHEALANETETQANAHRLKASVLIEAIVSGIDIQHGETPAQILQLCEFVMHSVSQGDLDGIQAGIRALETIQSGFRGIQNEATALEESGEIPPLEMNLAVVDSLS